MLNLSQPSRHPVELAPSLRFDFMNASSFPCLVTTRAGAIGYFDAAGVFTLSGNNESPIDHDPVTLARKGLLVAPSRTNGIRNSRLEGAVAGTPGTFPTNAIASSMGTVAANIVGAGTVNGMPYVEVRYVGTTNGTGAYLYIPEPTNVIVSANGQTWTFSVYMAIVAGSLANFTSFNPHLLKYPGGSGFGSAPNLMGTLDGTLRRFAGVTGTISDGSNTHVQPRVSCSWSNGAAIDVTIRYAGFQCEQGADASPLILAAPGSPAATTRPAGAVKLAGAGWFNPAEGTLALTARSAGAGGAGIDARLGGFANAASPDVNNQVVAYLSAVTPNNLGLAVQVAGATTAQPNTTSGTAVTSRFRCAGAFKANDFGFVVNGVAASPDTSGALPGGMDGLVLGSDPGNPGASSFNGWYEVAEIHPRRLPAAELLVAGAAP